jgi:hypothetical protein
MFKRIFLLMFLAPAIMNGASLVLPKDSTAEERAFLTNVNDAIIATNVDSLFALQYFDGVDISLSDYFRPFYRDMISSGCVALRLERADPATSTERMEGNDKIRENLPVHWIMTVTNRPPPYPGATMTTTLRVGLFNGKMRITTSIVVKKTKNGTNDLTTGTIQPVIPSRRRD